MWTLYKERHDRVVFQLMVTLVKVLDVKVPDYEVGCQWLAWGGHTRWAKIAFDLSVPTDRQLSNRWPDILLYLKEKRTIMILEGAVAWKSLVAEWEHQKTDKYRELTAALGTQHPGWRVPIVILCLRTLRSLKRNIEGLGIFIGVQTGQGDPVQGSLLGS